MSNFSAFARIHL